MNEPIENRLRASATIGVSHPQFRGVADNCMEGAYQIEYLKAEKKQQHEEIERLKRECDEAYERAAEFYENAMSYGVKTTKIADGIRSLKSREPK